MLCSMAWKSAAGSVPPVMPAASSAELNGLPCLYAWLASVLLISSRYTGSISIRMASAS